MFPSVVIQCVSHGRIQVYPTTMGNSRLRFKSSLYNIFIFLFILLYNVDSVLCFEIGVTNLDEIGSCVFNTSHGHGWSYRIDPLSTSAQALEYLSLDASTGTLYLSKQVTCSDSPPKLLHYRIISKKNHLQYGKYNRVPANRTVTSLTLKVKRHRCPFVPNHTKQLPQTKSQNAKHYISLYSMYLDRDGGCLPGNVLVFKLQDYIPSYFTTCDHFINNVNNPDFTYDKKTDELTVTKDFCVNDDQISFSAQLIIFCKDLVINMELKILMKGTKQSVDNNMFLNENRPHKSRIRLRRNANYNKAPVFASLQYSKTVKEEQNPGVHVITITATDPDEGDAGVLTYSLSAVNDQRSIEMFTIQPSSGSITTTKRLDRETISEHKLQIIATDNGYPNARSAQTFLTVTVEDINDHKPVFEESIYYRNISESASISTPVLSVKATDSDIDKNAEIRYRFVNPSSSAFNAFMIDPISGSITTKTTLDREKLAEYKFTVQAIDQGSDGQQSSTASVNIFVLDENDNSPQFSQKTYHVEVAENHSFVSDPKITKVTATDLDAGDNSLITYSIFGGNIDNTFRLDHNTGELFIQKNLDRESHSQFSIQVRAQDGGSPMHANTTTVIVEVTDINDNDPEFFGAPYIQSVQESEDVGSTVLQVQAQDIDEGKNGDMKFSITGVADTSTFPFDINERTGEVKIKSKLDREKGASYSFDVVATDQGVPQRQASAKVQITVLDVNDNAPKFKLPMYNTTVSEDAKQGTNVIRVTAEDADYGDNARVEYSILSGNINDAFRIATINGAGQIMVANTLNYKQVSQYFLFVRAKDSGDLYDDVEVRIRVLDTNQHTPVFQGTPYHINVDENTKVGRSVYKVFAKDDDIGENARITYELHGSTSFSIDHVTGEISTRVLLDREQKSGEAFHVTARDHGKPSKTATTDVQVTIMDINDNSPEFSKGSYTGKVPENAKKSQSVLQIAATDRDDRDNAFITYTFNGGNSGNGDFEIDSASGTIRVNKPLDRETIAVYHLKAFAVDKGVPPRSTSVGITIFIEDINDNAPVFPSPDIEVRVMENTPVGTIIAQISAVDPDEGPNAEIDYEKVGGWDGDLFKLESRPGGPAIIKNLVDLDYESDKKVYQVMIKANSKPFFKEAMLNIVVQDMNDNKPILKDFTIIFNNYVDNFISGVIGRIPATDPDEMDRDKLIYHIIAGNNASFLHLNQTTGYLTLDYRLNSDVPRNGTMQVRVSDGKNDVKATCRLYVRLVTDEMLENSVTIRLNNMTQTAFLSPLYKFFVDALATIMRTEEKDVYVINIQNDTEVKAQVLNISVSVKKPDGTFYSAEFLQEQIYLQRILLANLSTLQVLPFDDNLCVIEPCSNFATCSSSLKFGKASPFISSYMMLFRPIHPENGYSCDCTRGFTGNKKEFLCDIEVDLCYSSPCQNDGTCIRKEGGYSCHCAPKFAGENCEYNMTMKYTALTCPSHLCKPPSRCVPLIKGGFRCEGCPNEAHLNSFCQLTTRRFPKGSFLTFPALKQRNRLTIELEFATQQRNGILFYNGRFNEKHDFIALEIIDGQVQFSFSLGSNITTVSTNLRHKVNDGSWQKVKVQYRNRTVNLTVGEDCDTQINILYGSRLSNYSCAATVTHTLPDRCVKQTNICHRLFDLTGPLQIGGLPKLPSTFQVQNKDFEGCIRNVYIDSVLLDLNTSVSNVGTQPGCAEKKAFCLSSPCKSGGTCTDAWGDYKCQCPKRSGGQNCGQVIDEPRMLDGSAFLMYSKDSFTSTEVHLTWHNGLSFRTRAHTGALMYIILSDGHTILMELQNGYVHYGYSYNGVNQNFLFDSVKVNDGKWHYFEVQWKNQRQLVLRLDYGIWEKIEAIQGDIENKKLERVYVGAQRVDSGPISKGFKGCVQNMVVGNGPSAILTRPTGNNDVKGCFMDNPCDSNPCSNGATCVDEWGDYSCLCPRGTLGPNCEDICRSYNPCQIWSNCRGPTFGVVSGDYKCECGKLQSGKYCEEVSEQPCPASWYGYPICGPCNCSNELGFSSSCNKTTGECYCKEAYYRPPGSDRCLPCDCYMLGSNNRFCHPVTGQCDCLATVVGRRCDQCESKFAEVTLKREGCKVNYFMCPRTFTDGVWWSGTPYGNKTVTDCPNGAQGEGIRACSEDGNWHTPDLYNCTSKAFVELQKQLHEVESGDLKINTFVAKTMMRKLHTAVVNTEVLYGSDISITIRILSNMLDYENQQKGLSLTSEQDSTYIPHMMEIMSKITDTKYKKYWIIANKNVGGAAVLLYKLEKHLIQLSENLAVLQSKPFSVVADNIVLVMDNISKQNFSGQKFPKFDNIVHKSTFDDDTFIYIPKSTLTEQTLSEFLSQTFHSRNFPTAYVGFIMYRTLCDMLPASFDTDVREIAGRPLDVNAPVISLLVRDNGQVVTGELQEPIKITFKQQQNENRTSPQCVYWDHKANSMSGAWSTAGCTVEKRYEVELKQQGQVEPGDVEMYVVCSCNHMTSFGMLMDIAETEYVAEETISLVIFSFIGIAISLACLFVAFFIFMCFKHLQCNANSILINLVFVIFVAEFSFIIGVYRTEPELFCRLISIALHYFYLSAFSWLFVEMLHIYRRLSEIKDINYGAMKFYYLIGYVIPGIIVGLSVGLYTDGYGGTQFCWLDMSKPFIWSFAGPVVLAVIVIIAYFVLALKASCREKVHVSDVSAYRMRMFCGLVVLLLLGLTWILGLVSVNLNYTSLHYVYSVFAFSQGMFIFIAYIIFDRKVRRQLKKQWYKCQGKKLEMEENLGAPRGSRSALAYRQESSTEGYLNRTGINVGISTTSTTSRSTSKSSGGLFKGDDYLRSTSTSTSGHVPSESLYPPNTGIPPYGYDSKAYHEKKPNDGSDTVNLPNKRSGQDSDSDSDASVGHNSLSLASSHSSDEDDEIDFSNNWEKQLPVNKKVEEAKEEARKKKKERDKIEAEKKKNLLSGPPPIYSSVVPQSYGHWPGDPNLSGFHMSESDYRPSDQVTMSSAPPDVLPTLPAQELQGHRDYIIPPVRTDSLLNDSSSTNHSPHDYIPSVLDPRMKVQVLTHNGSISSDDSECSHETSV